MTKTILSSFILSLLLTTQGHAKLFSNSYVSFELPPRWECSAEGTEWICRSGIKGDTQTAIIILTAKEVGPSDGLTQYESFLKQPKVIPDNTGRPFTSQVKGVKVRKINDQDWADGLHLGSELPTFYTRYLATTKQTIAVLVTFSAHKRYYTKFSNDFFKAILSLRVNAPQKITTGSGQIRGAGESLGSPLGSSFPSDMLTEDSYPDEVNEKSGTKEKIFGFGLLLAAVGAYIVIKRRKKNS